MKLTDIVSPLLNTGRTIAVENFEYINPINIYNKLTQLPSVANMFQASTAGVIKSKTLEGVDETTSSETTPSETTTDISIVGIVFLIISVFFTIGMISFVINDMIMHPWIVRLIMSIILVIISVFNPLTPFIIMIYYFVSGMWKYYINSTLPPSEMKRIIPYIYGFIPLTTSQPTALLGKILIAPFRYDADSDSENLKWDRKEWLKTILGSFSDAKATLAIGGMNGLYKQYKDSLDEVHEFERVVKKGETETVIRANPFNDSSSQKKDTPVVNNQVKDTPVANTPVANTPVKDTPVANTPAKDTPVVNIPVKDTPVANNQVKDTPVANAPVANTTVKEEPKK